MCVSTQHRQLTDTGNIAIGVYVKSGSAFETMVNNGTNASILHMLKEHPAIRALSDATQVNNRASAITLYAVAGREYTCLTLHGPVNRWMDMLTALATALRSPVFTPTAMACAIADRQSECQHLRSHHPEVDAMNLLHETLWHRRQLGLSPLGDCGESAYDQITTETVDSFYNAWWSPDRILVCCVYPDATVTPSDFMTAAVANFEHCAKRDTVDAPYLAAPIVSERTQIVIQPHQRSSGVAVHRSSHSILAFVTRLRTARERMILELFCDRLTGAFNDHTPSVVPPLSATVLDYDCGHILVIQADAAPAQHTMTTVADIVDRVTRAVNAIAHDAMHTEQRTFDQCKHLHVTATVQSLRTTMDYLNYYALEALFLSTNDPLDNLRDALGTVGYDEYRATVIGAIQSRHLTIIITGFGDDRTTPSDGQALRAAIERLSSRTPSTKS